MDLEEADQWLNPSSDYPLVMDPSPEAFTGVPLDPNNRSEVPDWDPKTVLTNLCFLEQKIHQLQQLVHAMAAPRDDPASRLQQHHLVTADVTSIIAQLISAAGSLLPAAKRYNNNNNNMNNNNNNNNNINNNNNNDWNNLDEHEAKEEEEAEDGESMVPGTYEILQLEKEEILAPHTHFCAICGKGFKRDANLRMHMRGHGDEYKTPAALAKPQRDGDNSTGGPDPAASRRYSCPFGGCKRNKDHKKFQPLKTILCVKNHYKRTHCDKSHACSRCKTKKFSVVADLKTHEKHCGKDKWLCSCGTTFSRKDKLFGHISLFQGHTPAIPPSDDHPKPRAEPAAPPTFDFGSAPAKDETLHDPGALFSPINFDTCNFGGFHEFPRPPYEDSDDTSFSFLLAGSCSNYPPRTLRDSNTNDLV